MKLLVNEADILRAETQSRAQGDGGGSPRPIRKRGYHRALKSKKIWAVIKKQEKDLILALCKGLYTLPGHNDSFWGVLDREAMKRDYPLANSGLEPTGLLQWLPEIDK